MHRAALQMGKQDSRRCDGFAVCHYRLQFEHHPNRCANIRHRVGLYRADGRAFVAVQNQFAVYRERKLALAVAVFDVIHCHHGRYRDCLHHFASLHSWIGQSQRHDFCLLHRRWRELRRHGRQAWAQPKHQCRHHRGRQHDDGVLFLGVNRFVSHTHHPPHLGLSSHRWSGKQPRIEQF